ncbi:hypothetical protein [Methylobacterium haplocladii]|uniref:Uncharacterized protein n=1 Tax=Methylobacterium haplocladii TaxID=1176176 RepID=A0A512IPH6_9HYPH|nr:hypothetical protein [Methylobacterium haplocladii]GEO99606.1 hypothetical protein MHA02_19940 [Methylobacterium haplocladii]GJD85897.1 hypothetical protein HPGCJGGD_3792 [Methylobacterium haplocladii]GLS58582.1 hypothetical protein GCM10007887_12460 [Methylobacterium haplocladii]
MSVFPIDEGSGGAGTGSYACGLLTLANGEARGVEAVASLTAREDATRRSAASQRVPGFLDTLRGALPASTRLSMPARLAVSTVRAGLGVIEEGFAPGGDDLEIVEVAFSDGASLVARMPAELVAAIRHDREIALGVLARSGRTQIVPAEAMSEADDSAEALTSIFRYEKRNGRLRRVIEAGPDSKD